MTPVGPSTLGTDDNGWWDEERRRFLAQALGSLAPGLFLDVGCGRGSIAQASRQRHRYVVGVDAYAYPEWHARPGVGFVVAAATALPFRSGCFDLVGSFDVVEHLDDDVAAVGEMARVVAAHGAVAVTVPASPRLWSRYDEIVGHRRRYTRSSLAMCLRAASLKVVRHTHFFGWLVLPALLLGGRRAAVSGGGEAGCMARVARVFGSMERWWLRHRRVPIGTSIFMLAEREGSSK